MTSNIETNIFIFGTKEEIEKIISENWQDEIGIPQFSGYEQVVFFNNFFVNFHIESSQSSLSEIKSLVDKLKKYNLSTILKNFCEDGPVYGFYFYFKNVSFSFNSIGFGIIDNLGRIDLSSFGLTEEMKTILFENSKVEKENKKNKEYKEKEELLKIMHPYTKGNVSESDESGEW